MRVSARGLYKIGKKLCFPDVPSNWICSTKTRLLYPHSTPTVNFDDHEEDEKYWVYQLPDDDSTNEKYWFDLYKDKNDAISWCEFKEEKLMDLFNSNPEPQLQSTMSMEFEKGKTLDVLSLLSMSNNNGDYSYLIRNNGDMVPIDSLRGKNVVVCCFYVPVLWLDHKLVNNIRGIITHHIASEGEYEMVMVAKMRDNWDNDEDAFNHFFSAFTPSCLAIPFQDTHRRNYVCTTLGLGLTHNVVGIRVDSNLKVVGYDDSLFYFNGFQFHPYTTACSFNLDVRPWEPTSQLDSLLGSDFVYKINDVSGDNKVSISEFKDKLVGLYLCYDGSFIPTLDFISHHCKARNQEFLVVMVYLPYKESTDPCLFVQAINHVLRNLNVSNWWVSPFNDLVSRRIWEFYSWKFYDNFDEDKLLILDPNVNYIDPYGKYVFDSYGIDAYPYTREFIVNKELEEIRAATLESWLGFGSRDYVIRMNINDDIANVDKVSIAELSGKMIFLYVAHDSPYVTDGYYNFLVWYYKNKKARLSDFEAVFIPTIEDHPSLTSTPFLVCPYDPQYKTFVVGKILKGRGDTIIAFGKDGHIITLDALYLLDCYEKKGFPSLECYDGLRDELISHVGEIYELDMTGLIY